MPLKRLSVATALAAAFLISAPLLAQTAPEASVDATATQFATAAPLLMTQLPVFAPAPGLAQSVVPSNLTAELPASANDAKSNSVDDMADADDDGTDNANGMDLRHALIGLAMKLRDIRYVRGGHDPSTGFDCSGFVRYVFAHAVGLELPTNSASQFVAGLAVKRADMRPGDLVFFRTAGRGGRGRISHVGIYIDNVVVSYLPF